MAFHEVRSPAVAAKQLRQLFAGDARQERGVGDFVPVEVKDRQNGAVRLGVEELVGMPRGRKRPGFGLPIANHTGNEQAWVVEHSAEGVTQRVAELPAFMDRTRAFRRGVTRDAARERELFE